MIEQHTLWREIFSKYAFEISEKIATICEKSI